VRLAKEAGINVEAEPAIKNRWRLQYMIGSGSFGEIYGDT
jgi:hypothetical protein